MKAESRFCKRHEELLETAVELRGMTPDKVGPTRQLIVEHATHFAGRAAIEMLSTHVCAMCFINNNPSGVNLDDWVNEAANEILHSTPDEKPIIALH